MAQYEKPKRGPKGDWIARWREPADANGRRRRRSQGGFAKQSEAQAYQQRMVGLQPILVQDVADRFQKDFGWRSDGRAESVKYALAKLTAEFGPRQADTITLLDLQGWRRRLTKSQWNTTQAAKQMFAWAEKTGLIAQNPARHLRNPQPPANEVRPFSDSEVEAVARELGATYGRIAVFVSETGMRPGEWLALEWGDIDRSDPRRPFARVERRLTPDFKLALPKNGKRRKVPLTSRALEALDDLVGTRHFKLCFPGPSGNYMRLRIWRRDHWNPAIIGAGFTDDDGKADRTPYALRHTWATNALRAGLSTWTVAQRMGTSVQMIERTYGHHAEDAIEWELERLNRRLGRDVDVAAEGQS